MTRPTGYGFAVTLLPIAVRELRVSARNKATHRVRRIFALAAVGLAAAIWLLSNISGGFLNSQLGIAIFAVLKWIAFVLACSAGVFLTADCLSEEKREGTLGLLFLTDLRGYDVVVGKLAATSLAAFYGLLAIFPVMALSFILGGIAIDDFQHTLIALCNALFFSLSLGMAVSAFSRAPHKAITAAFAFMLIALFLFPSLAADSHSRTGGVSRLELLSPLYAFLHPVSYPAAAFWYSILAVQISAWLLLAAASWLTPKTWQEKNAQPAWRFPLLDRFSTAAGKRLRDKNPVCWIIARDRWTANLARFALVLALVLFVFSLASLRNLTKATPPAVAGGHVTSGQPNASIKSTNGDTYYVVHAGSSRVASSGYYVAASTVSAILSFALELWLVAQVCRFYIDGRKSGFLELLRVTPVTSPEVLRGHWLALRRLFLPPLAAQLFLTLVCGVIQVWATASTVTLPPTTGGKAPFAANQFEFAQLLSLAMSTITWTFGLLALVWFSIWMGLTSKRLSTAMLKVFCFVKVIPWIAITFVSGIVMVIGARALATGNGASYILWLWPVTLNTLLIVANIFLICFARIESRSTFTRWPD
jgi:hypothetical protein